MKRDTQSGTREDTTRAFRLYDALAAETADADTDTAPARPARKSGWSARYAVADDGIGELVEEDDDFFAIPKPKKKKGRETPAATRACRSAVNILNYATCSAARLAEKLARKGFAPADVEAAILHVRQEKLLDEARDVAHAVEYMANARLYGKRKIVESLYAKGYRRAEIEAADWDALDFTEICARFLARQNRASFADAAETDAEVLRAAREKTIAAARRRGFSMREILAALDAQ